MTTGDARPDGGLADANEQLMLLRTAVHLYLTARSDLARGSIIKIRSDLLLACRHIGPNLLVRSLKRRHVESWLASMNVAPATARGRLSAMRTFCQWAIAHGHLKADPTLGVKGPRQPVGMPRELDAAQIRKTFLSAPDARAELILSLGVQEGLRVSEIARLLRENIDVGQALMLVQGKNSKERWLPISPDTAQAMAVYVGQHPGRTGPVIRSEPHPARGLSSHHIATLVTTWFYDAGIKHHAYDGVSIHALRHSMAGAMLDDGADIRDVQNALGHTSLGPTYVYLKRRQGASQLRKSMGKRTYRG